MKDELKKLMNEMHTMGVSLAQQSQKIRGEARTLDDPRISIARKLLDLANESLDLRDEIEKDLVSMEKRNAKKQKNAH